MNLPEIAVRRHVLAYMLSGVFVLFGLISFDRIGVDRYPRAEFPMISIVTRLRGADPTVIDASVTNTIEKAVNSVSGIEHVESSSQPDFSIVRVRFALEKDLDVAFQDVQAKVNQALPQLPREIEQPVVAKVEIGAQPVIWLALSGDRTLQQLNVYAENVVKRRLETINGVGEVRIGGQRLRTIRVEIGTARLAAFGITVQDLQRAFEREHVRLPGGFLVSGATEEMLKADLEFHDLDTLGAMIVAQRDGAAIRLRDVANIRDDLEDYRLLARFNGEPTVGVGIIKVQNANTVAVVDEVKRRLEEEILPQLPPGLKLEIAHDEGALIGKIVDALNEHLVLGTLLTALVVLVFLRNLRSTLIIAAAIPVSLLGAVAVIYFLGYTFNTMTLLGLLLLIGVVVDDAIVVLESVFRHREQEASVDPVTATLHGTQEVVLAVLAATLTLVSIFTPVAFMQGMTARLFQSFAVVVTAGVLVSLLVSLTLTPMLCARHLRLHEKHTRVHRVLERAFGALDDFYRRTLRSVLVHRWLLVLVTVLALLSSGWVFGRIGKGFFPAQDDGYFLVTVKLPLGASIEHTAERLDRVDALLRSVPEVAGTFTTVGDSRSGKVNEATIIVHLVPWEKRSASQKEIIARVGSDLAGIAGIESYPAPASPIGGMRGEQLHFVLTGPDLAGVAKQAEEMRRKLADDPAFGNIDLDLELALPQLALAVDRDQLARAGLSSEDAALALGVLAGGRDIAYYNDEPGDGERYRVRLKAADGELDGPDALSKIYLRTPAGELLRLDSVARLAPGLGAAEIARYDLQYAANFRTAPRVSEGEGAQRAMAIGAELPPGYRLQLAGRAEEFRKTAGYMQMTFITAMVLVYMVLASQFNSFVQPLIIMVAQPLAIIGGVFSLWLFGHTINLFSMIGLVLLVGLVAKNSILLVDLTNQLRLRGQGIDEALLAACPVRMRPVLMTSATIILAMLPAAIGVGAGSDTNGPLAVAVIGGMISSTLLTLVVVPVVYSLVEHALARRSATA